MHRIVVVGGGAGGIELATRLGDKLGKSRKAHITLIDRCATHIWKPLLHEVATGVLDTHLHEIEYAAQARWHHFDFVQGEMIDVSRSARRVVLAAVVDEDAPDREILPERGIEYDTLVLALGSRTHFFGVKGAAEHAVTLDTVEQADRLRRKLLETCVRTRVRGEAGDREGARIVIVGAGATGVELASELRKMETELRRFRLHSSDPGSTIHVTLVEASPRILPALPAEVSQSASALLGNLGIDVRTGDRIVEVREHEVHMHDGQVVPSDMTIWAAGITAPKVLSTLDGLAVNNINQVKVTPALRSETDENVFAFGDCASCSWDNGKIVPPRAQAAHQQAVFLANALRLRVLGRPIGEFRYSDYGSLVSLGPASAVGSLRGRTAGRGIFVRGLFADFLYASLYRKHLAAVSGWRKMAMTVAVHALRRFTSPRVKLH